MNVFVTGATGFIGYHVTQSLLAEGHTVAGYDGMTDHHDLGLKRARLANLAQHQGFSFIAAMLEDGRALAEALRECGPDIVIHLAAHAGVRHALDAPGNYLQSNVFGTSNLLEALRAAPPRHLLFASTGSVYGGNQQTPSCETDRTDYPMSPYAATKKAGELMCHSSAHLFGIPTTVLRFFTVYGPWGRPDMALFKFVRAILEDRSIEIYGGGQMRRDFTYIDDLVDAILALLPLAPSASSRLPEDSLSPVAPYRIVNITGGRPVGLLPFVDAIEEAVGRKAKRVFLPMQPGDVINTYGSPGLLGRMVQATPQTPIGEGVARFVDWYRGHYSTGV